MKTKNNFQNFEDFTMIPTKESDTTNDFIQITKQTKTLNDSDWDSMLLTPDNIKNMKPQVQNQIDFLKNKQPSLQEFILEYSHGQSSSSNHKSANVADAPSSVDSSSTSNSTEKKTVNLLELLAKKDNSSPPSNSKGAMSSEPINPQPSTGSRYASPSKSPVKSERWAGAAFSNSPAPSSLPIPAFALDQSSPSLSSSLERNASPYKQPTRSNFSPLKSPMDQPFSSTKSLQQELPTKQPKPILKKSRPTSPPNATSSSPSSSLSVSAKQKQYVPKAQSQLVQSETATPISPAITNHMSSKAQVNAQEQVPDTPSSLPKALLVAAQHHQHHQYQYPNQQQHQALQGGVVLPSSSPAQNLDQLSNQLKMMLNICPVRS